MIRRADIVDETLGWLGTPYQHQASLKGVACDCLGLVRGVWRALRGPEPEAMPAYAPDWAEFCGRETLLDAAGRHLTTVLGLDQALPGDVLLFRWRPDLPAKHCAILVAPERIVHAYDAAGAVTESSLVPAWKNRIAGVFAFPGAV